MGQTQTSEFSSVHQKRSEPSCESLKSDRSLDPPPMFESYQSLFKSDRSLLESYRSLLESYQSLLERYRSLMKSDQSLLERDRSLLERDRSLLERERSLFESERSLFESDRSLFEGMRSQFESFRSLFESFRSLFENERSWSKSVWSLFESDRLESYQRLLESYQRLLESYWSFRRLLNIKSGDLQPGLSSVHQKRSEPSCVSLKSDRPLFRPPMFESYQSLLESDLSFSRLLNIKSGNSRPGISSVHLKRSEPSCVSLKSDWSMIEPISFKSVYSSSGHRSVHQKRSEPSCESVKSHTSSGRSKHFKTRDTWPGVSHEFLSTFKSNLKRKFECVSEGTGAQRNPTLLNEIYTELYITESERGEISNEHEVRQIETQSRRTATEDTAIKCRDLFRPLPGQDKAIRTVLTEGVAGIGKTISVQKFILDWAEGKDNQDIQFIFPLSFREINLMKNKTLSLSGFLHVFFPETKELNISSDEHKVLFVFDGLDECRLSLDFKNAVRLSNIYEPASVDVLLMNLILGNLLPSAHIWITSRPAAADPVPSECVHRVTEVRGFNEPQKEEYFRKRISDQSLTDRIISHLKSSSSLFIMCHIPIFCWILATVLEKILSQAESEALTQALLGKNGHLDLFLWFLLGLSVESNQTLLQKLLPQAGSCSYKKEETVQYIKQKIRENHSPERSINLFHCLNELGDDSLMKEIQDYLKSGKIRETRLSSLEWSALVYVLLTSEQKMDVFGLNQFFLEHNILEMRFFRICYL